MQSGDWKLMEYLEDGKLELYNLRDDLGETRNLATGKPEIASQMHARMVAWRKEINAPMPVKNQPSTTPDPAKKAKKAGKKQ